MQRAAARRRGIHQDGREDEQGDNGIGMHSRQPDLGSPLAHHDVDGDEIEQGYARCYGNPEIRACSCFAVSGRAAKRVRSRAKIDFSAIGHPRFPSHWRPVDRRTVRRLKLLLRGSVPGFPQAADQNACRRSPPYVHERFFHAARPACRDARRSEASSIVDVRRDSDDSRLRGGYASPPQTGRISRCAVVFLVMARAQSQPAICR